MNSFFLAPDVFVTKNGASDVATTLGSHDFAQVPAEYKVEREKRFNWNFYPPPALSI
jgi:hypothetical protein